MTTVTEVISVTIVTFETVVTNVTIWKALTTCDSSD